MVYEPRACGKILTKMIPPSDEDVTAVTLIAEKDINVNRKVQRCYIFYVEDDEICYATKGTCMSLKKVTRQRSSILSSRMNKKKISNMVQKYCQKAFLSDSDGWNSSHRR
jgi:hypothetical protein